MGCVHEDISTLLNAFVCDAEAVAHLLARRYGLPIASGHVENALVQQLGLNASTELLDFQWTQETILSALANYNLQKFFPTLLAEVRFQSSVVPPGVIRRLVEQTVRRHGEVWRIYQNDADPFPSDPHGHNVESGHKLHLGTGELFLKSQPVGRISRKDLLAIRSQLVNFALPTLAC
jgi:hypothetical protein